MLTDTFEDLRNSEPERNPSTGGNGRILTCGWTGSQGGAGITNLFFVYTMLDNQYGFE